MTDLDALGLPRRPGGIHHISDRVATGALLDRGSISAARLYYQVGHVYDSDT